MRLIFATKAKQAAILARKIPERARVVALNRMAKTLEDNYKKILASNQLDLAAAKKAKLSAALLDRLELTRERIKNMVQGVRQIAHSPQVVGQIVSQTKRPDGLVVKRERIPLGVILFIFESRPNVVVDAAALAIKSGNSILLKGGKEAKHTNQVLGQLINQAIASIFTKNFVQVLSSTDRSLVQKLLKQKDAIDLVIPRGGEALVAYVTKNSLIPVIAHFKGLCHMYIHHDADLDMAKKIVVNAKTQRTGVCNAMECLLLNRDLADEFLEELLLTFLSKGTELFVDAKLKKQFRKMKLKTATKKNYQTEYLDNKLSIKLVDSLDEAIAHIHTFGTHHTEGIITRSKEAAEKFATQVDASCITHNASTRFNDGYELGLGAEVGISTSKFHAYGPMGAAELTTTRFKIYGSGHIRA